MLYILIEDYLKKYESNISLLIKISYSLLELKKLEKVEKYAKEILYKFNNKQIGYKLLGIIEYNKNNISKSRSYFEKALENGLPEKYLKKLFVSEAFYNDVMSYEENSEELPF